MKIDNDMAELIGIHIGDGCISKTKRYAEYYLGGDLKEEKDYHNQWVAPLFNKKIMLPLFNKKVKYKGYPKVGIYGFYIFNKKLVKLFESMGITSGSKINLGVPQKIKQNKMLSKRFIRGLFDTDGSIYFEKNRCAKNPINKVPNIKLGSVSKKLIEDVFQILIDLGMNPRLKKPYKGKKDKNHVHNILIYRKKDILSYLQIIGFKNPKHHTKWQIFQRFGFCPPKTSLKERKDILSNNKKLY